MATSALAGSGAFAPDMTVWTYDRAPTVYDEVANDTATNAVRFGVHALIGAYLRLCHGLTIDGAENLRRASPCIIVANHCSHYDAPVLMQALGLGRVNAVRSLAAKDYFFANPVTRMVTFLIANTIPIDRRRFDAQSLASCRRALDEGSNIVIFPEGTRSPDGNMRSFHAGIGILVKTLGVAVVPAHIAGTHTVLPKGRIVPRPGRLGVRFGQSVEYVDEDNSKHGWRRIAADLHGRVAALGRRETYTR